MASLEDCPIGSGMALLGADVANAAVPVVDVVPTHEVGGPGPCGFEAFEDSRMKFDVRYYLVAILFIVFDLEIAFLFPWAVALGKLGLFGLGSMAIFLGILVVGFIYEWKKGALEWD